MTDGQVWTKRLLVVIFVIALTACGGGGDSDSSDSDNGADGGASDGATGGNEGSGSDTDDDTNTGGDGDDGDDSGGPMASSSAAACFNPALARSGTTYSQTLRITGQDGTQETATSAMVNGAAVFEPNGKTATETILNTTTPSDLGPVVSEIRQYTDFDTGTPRARSYGAMATSTVDTGSGQREAVSTTVFDPFTSERFNLAPGEGFSESYTATTTIEAAGGSAGIPGGSGTTLDVEREVTYEGPASVTVPAGTFDTCKFHSVTTTTVRSDVAGLPPSVSDRTYWIAVDFGLSVQEVTVEDGGDRSKTVLVSASVNGEPVDQ